MRKRERREQVQKNTDFLVFIATRQSYLEQNTIIVTVQKIIK